MAICENCGGEYEDSLTRCPYCGTEDLQKAAREQEQEVNTLHRKTWELRKEPEQKARKATRLTMRTLLILVILFAAVLAGGAAVTALRSSTALQRQQRQLEKLEALYRAGDYEGMGDCLDSMSDAYGGTFEKYNRVSRLYSAMEWRLQALENHREYAGRVELKPEDVADSLANIFLELCEIEEMRKEGFPYGEEEGALAVEQGYRQALLEYALLDEDEIARGIQSMSMENAAAQDLTELAETVITRMKEAEQ